MYLVRHNIWISFLKISLLAKTGALVTISCFLPCLGRPSVQGCFWDRPGVFLLLCPRSLPKTVFSIQFFWLYNLRPLLRND